MTLHSLVASDIQNVPYGGTQLDGDNAGMEQTAAHRLFLS